MRYLLLAMLLMAVPCAAQVADQQECEDQGGYWKQPGGGTCLLPNDMDEDQVVLFKDLNSKKQELAQALKDQQQFNNANANARRAGFDARIVELEAKRDATDGRPATAYQEEIDRLTRRRDRLDFTCADDPDPAQCVADGREGPRDKAAKLGPVVSQLNQDIVKLKRDLDASIP